ncbi:MAG TPA: 5-formyltetrahydrofolate cyclo-ligase, partial [Trueperaceae bacterium]|nr:5-formyltetrahydrofolate cyclo-ligase [Trueperaceae bacterium]
MGTRTAPNGALPTPDPAWDKSAWRAWARLRRASFRAEAGYEPDADAARHLISWAPMRSAEVVGVYLAFGTEVDLADVITEARATGKRLVAPRCHAGPPPHLTLHELREDSELVRHALGHLEPPADAPQVSVGAVDVLLVPGLVFDERGYRLGFGLGYYDRLIPRLRTAAGVVGVTL